MRLPILLTALLTTALLGQMPAPPLVDPVKTYLNLQDSQIQALQQLRQQEMQALESTLKELAAKQQSLREQLDRGSTDAAALGRLLTETEALRQRATRLHESFRAQAVNLLNAEQRDKLAALEQALKLQPAVQGAVALGLLSPLDPAGVPGPGVLRFGRGAGGMGVGPMMAPGGRGMDPESAPKRLRAPRSFPPLQQ